MCTVFRRTLVEIVRYKARLVARGLLHQKVVVYEEVYTPVARMDTIRVIYTSCCSTGGLGGASP